MALVIVGDPYTVTITGDPAGSDFPVPTPGGVGFASGAPVFGALTADAAAGLSRLASGAGTFAALRADGVAARVVFGAGAIAFLAMTATGASIVGRIAAGAVTLPALRADGAATVNGTMIANGAPVFGAFTADGASVVGRIVSGAPVFGALAADGAAEREVVASGTPAFPALAAGGASDVSGAIVTASGSPAFAALTADGAASRGPIVSGAATFGALAIGAAAQRDIAAGGGAAFGALTADGAADLPSDAAPASYIGTTVLPLAFGAGPINATVSGINAVTGRVAVIIATRRFNNSPFTSAVTIGGVPATRRDFVRTAIHQELSIWDAVVTAGGGDVVAVSVSGTLDRLGVSAWNVTGRNFVNAATVSTATAAAMNLPLTNAAGASVIAGVLAGAAANNFGWTNATENFDAALESPTSLGAALNSNAPGNVTVTVTPTGSNTDFLAIAGAYE